MTAQEWARAAVGFIGGIGGGTVAAIAMLYLWDVTSGWRR